MITQGTLTGRQLKELSEFIVDLDMSMTKPDEWDRQITVCVLARDRSHAAETAVMMAYQFHRPVQAKSVAVETMEDVLLEGDRTKPLCDEDWTRFDPPPVVGTRH